MKNNILNSNKEYFDSLYAKRFPFVFAINGFFSFNQKSKSKVNTRILKKAYELIEEPFSPKAVLDFGCGFGTFLFEFSKSVEICGVDISHHAIRHCEEAITASRRSGRFVVADGTDALPWPDNYFDVAISSHTLEHVEDEGFVLRELIRCMRPGGLLLINVPINETAEDEKHARKFSKEHLECLFRDFQLTTLVIEECDRLGGFLAVTEGKMNPFSRRVIARPLRGMLASLPERVWILAERFLKRFPFQQLVGVARKQ